MRHLCQFYKQLVPILLISNSTVCYHDLLPSYSNKEMGLILILRTNHDDILF
jgi:hypothetical protein